MSKFFKRTGLYRELRYLYRALRFYGSPFAYLYNRFIIGRKIRASEHTLDKPEVRSEYSVHLLCNHDGLDLLLWSLGSWHEFVERSGQVYIHEDGSFEPSDRQIISRLFPRAKIIDRAWTTGQIERWLANYPALLSFRSNERRYIYALKLVDPFFVSSAAARLIFDIDMLWFKNPEELLDLLLNQKKSFMIRSRVAMDFQFAGGSALPENQRFANAGIIGYQAEHYRLEILEEFISRNDLDRPERLIDQAGYVYVLSQSGNFVYLNDELYGLKFKPGLVARHYTGPVREKFWFEGIGKLKAQILK